jgi:hypothetical protein
MASVAAAPATNSAAATMATTVEIVERDVA